MGNMVMGDPIETQRAEFDAVAVLAQRYRQLPQIVDDDYPRARHHYDSALMDLIAALRANGCLDSNKPLQPTQPSDPIVLVMDNHGIQHYVGVPGGNLQPHVEVTTAGALVIYSQYDGSVCCGRNAVRGFGPGAWVTWRHAMSGQVKP